MVICTDPSGNEVTAVAVSTFPPGDHDVDDDKRGKSCGQNYDYSDCGAEALTVPRYRKSDLRRKVM